MRINEIYKSYAEVRVQNSLNDTNVNVVKSLNFP